MTSRRASATALALFVALGVLILVAPSAQAQNVASQKAYFGVGTTEIVNPKGAEVVHGYIKTSGVGDLLIGFSMECALWTTTSNTAKKGGGTTTSSSRAAVNVTTYVDGVQAEPGQVVYCDREQTVNLTFSSDTMLLTDAITLDLFLKTKNANHFNFYMKNPGSGVHYVEVYVESMVQTSAGSPDVVVNGTRAVVGKRTLVVEEYNSP